jgi:anti-sigma regulatory factor (Ser/Thr protein kinase)
MVLVFYFSNRNNKVNKWCATAAFLFWLGIAKEATLFSVLPMIEDITGASGLQDRFMPVYSFCTWALYSLAMPTTVVFSLYFYGLDNHKPKLLRGLKTFIYSPALVLTFFFPPHVFREYQLTSLSFWVSYASYNIILCALLVFVMIQAVRREKPGKTRNQRKWVTVVILPPVLFWTLSIFITHLFLIDGLFNLWRVNVFVVLAGVVFLFRIAFRDGFMGMKLTGETYNWDTNMNLINTGAVYTSHMLKTQTAKMALCIDNLKAQYASLSGVGVEPVEFEILSRSLSTLRNYMDRIKRHSQTIHLMQEPCKIIALLNDAVSVSPVTTPGITVNINMEDHVFWICDRIHMIEVFSNLLTNAAEAIRENGIIEITGTHDKNGYSLRFKDNGTGMDDDALKNMYMPYFTTKNTERNFGLGLAYCKNVIEKHSGKVFAKSSRGKGTTVTVFIPAKRVLQSNIQR